MREIDEAEIHQEDRIVHVSGKTTHDCQVMKLFQRFCSENVDVDSKGYFSSRNQVQVCWLIGKW